MAQRLRTLRRLLQEVIAPAADAQNLTRAALQRQPTPLRHWLALGKAAPAMVLGALEAGVEIESGIVVSVPGTWPQEMPSQLTCIQSTHPLPSDISVQAGRAALAFAARHQHVGLLLSGGTSALVEVPAPGVTLTDIRRITKTTLESGWSIDDINSARQRLSMFKGGGLLHAAGAGGHVSSYILSDVVGDNPQVIGSGPGCPPIGGTNINVERELASAFSVKDKASLAVHSQGRHPAPNDRSAGYEHIIVGSRHDVLRATCEALENEGVQVVEARGDMTGDAQKMGHTLATLCEQSGRAKAWIYTGEWTVDLGGTTGGQGGPMQEVALAFWLANQNPDAALLTYSTDGADGSSPAAGALVRGVCDALEGASEALEQHNAYGDQRQRRDCAALGK